MLEHFKEKGKWYPECSVTCALDESDESIATGQLSTLAVKINGVPLCSPEHDGMTFWVRKAEVLNMWDKAEEMTGVKMSWKQLEDPVKVAREKFRNRMFRISARLPAAEQMDHWQIAKESLADGSYRRNSHSFTTVLRDLYQEKIYKDPSQRRWIFSRRRAFGQLART